MNAASPLDFNALLLTARTEALTLLRALLNPDPDTPPTLLRERRMAATAILRLTHTPSSSGGGPGKGAKSDSPEQSHRQTPSPSGGAPERGTPHVLDSELHASNPQLPSPPGGMLVAQHKHVSPIKPHACSEQQACHPADLRRAAERALRAFSAQQSAAARLRARAGANTG